MCCHENFLLKLLHKDKRDVVKDFEEGVLKLKDPLYVFLRKKEVSMNKLWIKDKLYMVEDEVFDYIEELRDMIEKRIGKKECLKEWDPELFNQFQKTLLKFLGKGRGHSKEKDGVIPIGRVIEIKD